jgi:hypothetical protein
VTTPGSVILDENSVTLKSIAPELEEQPANSKTEAIKITIFFIVPP